MRTLVLALALAAPFALAGTVESAGDRHRLVIDEQGGLPVRWMSCVPDCVGGAGVMLLRPEPGGGRLRFVVPGDAAATAALNVLGYVAERREENGRDVIILNSTTPFRGRLLRQRYELDPRRRTLVMELQLPAGAEIELLAGSDFAPEKYPGFGGYYSTVRAVTVVTGEQETLAPAGEEAVPGRALTASDWAGIRGRFWTLMLRGDVPLVAAAKAANEDLPTVTLRPVDESGGTITFTLYGGPVAQDDLVAAAPELEGMLYAVLWTPLRWLSFGLQWILDRWQDLVGHAGLAILLLSLTVKLLMAPLIMIAERWQAQVNRIKSLLEPELAAIRREFRGEEAHNRTLAVYRRHGVSHFYTFKSLAGFMIQIPVFIAAFDMLGENFRLAGEGFLWISDLAAPDRFLALPMVLPFFGGHLNLLPLVMTLFTVLAARWQEEASLAPALRHGQRLKLYAMASLFLLLLYTFPAGMVLYWAANNFWHLLRVLWDRRPRGVTR
jgi:YidC/Oxa1 family membrane protein insertase